MTRFTFTRLASAALVLASQFLHPAPAVAGPIDGPIDHFDRVSARTTDIYRVPVEANAMTVISLLGAGNGDIDLYIHGLDGTPLGSSITAGDHEMVAVYSGRAEILVIEVVNLEFFAKDYVLTLR